MAGFLVHVRIEIQRVDERGGTQFGERLSVDESGTVSAETFADVAAILGRFHDLLTSLRPRAGEYKSGR